LLVGEFLEKLDGLPNDALISQKHVSAWLGISESVLEKSRVSGKFLQYFLVGQAVRYRVGDVRDYLAAHKVSHTSQAGEKGLGKSICRFGTGSEGQLGTDLKLDTGTAVPWAVIDGKLKDFCDSIGDDVEEIVWLTQHEYLSWLLLGPDD
jgi:hypothetical protein